MIDMYLSLITIFLFLGFLVYLVIDYMGTKNGPNAFFNKWTKKTVWLWLPFYALQRLIKEVILQQK